MKYAYVRHDSILMCSSVNEKALPIQTPQIISLRVFQKSRNFDTGDRSFWWISMKLGTNVGKGPVMNVSKAFYFLLEGSEVINDLLSAMFYPDPLR